MKKDQIRYASLEEYQEAQRKFTDSYGKKTPEKTRRVRVELVEDRYTGTLYEMEVEDDDDICPVIKEARK